MFDDFTNTRRLDIRGYDRIVALPKPFGFTEYGPHAPHKPPVDYDYRRFLAGLEQHFPKTRFFMAWNDSWSLAANRYTKELLAYPAVINRDNLPSRLFQER